MLPDNLVEKHCIACQQEYANQFGLLVPYLRKGGAVKRQLQDRILLLKVHGEDGYNIYAYLERGGRYVYKYRGYSTDWKQAYDVEAPYCLTPWKHKGRHRGRR